MHESIFRKAVLQLLIGIARFLVRNNPRAEIESGLASALGYAEQALADEEGG